jgi:hypothetical protein
MFNTAGFTNLNEATIDAFSNRTCSMGPYASAVPLRRDAIEGGGGTRVTRHQHGDSTPGPRLKSGPWGGNV